ncbi:PREDICTED: mucin-1-like, partial [Tauraco erythrolophus]
MSSQPPVALTASDSPPRAGAVAAARGPSSTPVSDPYTAGGFSGGQHGASVAGAMRSCNEQKDEVRPSPGLPGDEDHAAAPHLVPLPEVPSERASSLTKTHPGTVWEPSAVTPQTLWDTQPTGTFLRGKAALLLDAVLAKIPGNGSGLLATVSAPPPSAASARGVGRLRVLDPSLPMAGSEEPAVTLEEQSDLSSSPVWLTLLTSTKSHLSAWTRAPQTGVSSTAPDAIPEPGVTESPCKDGTAMVASPSPRAADVTRATLLGSPTQWSSLRPDPFLVTVSKDAPTTGQHGTTRMLGTSVLPGWVAPAEAAEHSEPRTASAAPAAAPAGPPGPTHASPSSAPPPSSKDPAPERCSEAVHHTSTTILLSPPNLLASTGVVQAASSLLSSQTSAALAGTTPDAQSMPSHSITSQHPSVTREHHPVAAGEASTPAELMTMGTPDSSGVKPPVSHPSPAQPLPVHVLPLQFRLLDIPYSAALSSRASGSYRELEEKVMLMLGELLHVVSVLGYSLLADGSPGHTSSAMTIPSMSYPRPTERLPSVFVAHLLLNQMLSTYKTFLWANILEFMNGSVVVRAEAVFRGDAPAPTNSHLIRTVVTEASRGRSTFSWQLEPQSVQSSGFSLENLDPEKLSISFTVVHLGRSRAEHLEGLNSEVVQSLSALYHVRNFTITQLRNLSGDLDITGEIYLDTIAHADVAEILQALTALATYSVDLTSLSVEGARLHLQVYPVSFLITNRHFSEDLMDPLAIGHQELSRDLGYVVARALRNHRSFLQVVIRGFLPGSLICHGDLVFQHPAPTSLEVLEALVLSVGPNKALAGSDFQVDPYSLAVGEDTLEPPLPEPGFPDYGVAILVLCSLCIITVPVILLVCLRVKRLSWRDVAVLWDRRDPEAGTQTLEMDNQGFWAASEQ